jgi:large subunit ribosomal protein L13
MIDTKPAKVVEHAIKGMLPKGKLGDQLFTKLHVFAGSEHPYKKQLKVEKVAETTEEVAQ